MNAIKQKVQYFIENVPKNSFVQNYKRWFSENGYEDCLFLCENTLLKTKTNLYEYAYGKGICKNCGIQHTLLIGSGGWKGWRVTCSFECEKELASKRQSGDNNTSHRMTDETKNAMKKKMSLIMKNKILRNEFTPNSENYLTHKLIQYRHNDTILKFRSSWELLYWIKNKHLEYESIRIKYFDSTKNQQRIYITDFYDKTTNTIIEIKPTKYQNQQYKDKRAECISQGYNFIVIDEKIIKTMMDIDAKNDIIENVIDFQQHEKRLSWIKYLKSQK